MRIAVVLFSFLAATPLLAADSACPAAWGYGANDGPNRWGQMNTAWARCDAGKLQSPVDIKDVTTAKLPKLTPRYGSFPLVVQNTGHDVNVPLGAGYVLFGDEKAVLDRFHFHVPSEHVVNGKRYAAEIHLVHDLPNGKALVIGVLIEEQKDANPQLAPIVDLIPSVACTSAKATDNYDWLNALLAANVKSYFNYNGSLTTPACDEGITWIVLREPIGASHEQIEKLSLAHDPGGNARPLQPRANRIIRAN